MWSFLAVIGGHVADLLRRHAHAATPEKARQHFVRALDRCMQDNERCGLPFGMIVFKFRPSMGAAIARLLLNGRGLDHTDRGWDMAGESMVLKLMPLTDLAGLQNYISRLDKDTKQAHDVALESIGISWFLWSISAEVEESLAQFCQRCNIKPLASEKQRPLLEKAYG